MRVSEAAVGKKDKKMELWEHLEELRIAVFKIIAALTCTTVLSFYFVNQRIGLLFI